MIHDLREINGEIARLESLPLSHDQCGKLAALYIVQQSNQPEPQAVNEQKPQPEVPLPVAAGKSEFVQIAYNVPFDDFVSILDRHMDAVFALYPKEYQAIIRRLQETL